LGLIKPIWEEFILVLKIVENMLTCDKFKHLTKSVKNSNRPTITNRAFLKTGTMIFFHAVGNLCMNKPRLKVNLSKGERRFQSYGYHPT
jgi:hypothetical protein